MLTKKSRLERDFFMLNILVHVVLLAPSVAQGEAAAQQAVAHTLPRPV